MERDYFTFKTHISFAIQSDVIDPDIITKEMDIIPADTSFKKGDTWIGKRTNKMYIRDTNIWRLETKWTEFEEETVSHHVEYLKSLLLPKIDVVKKYKENEHCDVSCWIWIETDDAGIGLYLQEHELKFLHEISNWVHFSLICKNEVKE